MHEASGLQEDGIILQERFAATCRVHTIWMTTPLKRSLYREIGSSCMKLLCRGVVTLTPLGFQGVAITTPGGVTFLASTGVTYSSRNMRAGSAQRVLLPRTYLCCTVVSLAMPGCTTHLEQS